VRIPDRELFTHKKPLHVKERLCTQTLRCVSAVCVHLSEALAAVDRAVALGLEGHTGFLAAVGAHSSEILAGTAAGILAGITACLAALRLVLEAPLGIECLLAGSEYKLVAAVFTHQNLVFVHFL
jgi:hypothetical protein